MDFVRCVFALDQAEEVISGVERDSIGAESDSRSNFSFAETVVEIWAQDESTHPAFSVVVA